nr:DEAD/DEAH box helicase [Acholeplasmatales bacterium]
PFELTKDQRLAILDIEKDITSKYPMNRLIQGDVGCGKSIVGIYAILAMFSAGYQSLLMLPTEILAIQQYNSLLTYFKNYGVNVSILTSSTKKRERDKILEDLRLGKINCLVGTHSLLNDEVKPYNLGLVVIDEQHKFGVNQRKSLIEKYRDVDAIYLTATPIPRTLGLTVFGDLDITSIKTMPEGRKIVNTKIVPFSKLNGLIKFLKQRILLGEQAYVVCPLIVENDDFDAIPVEEAKEIFDRELDGIKIDTIHGRISSDRKKEIMDSFMNNETKVLISTTVIEVGVNNPRATIMIILDANRFGLAQIHQLRGRVGRSDLQSYCALVTKKENNERLIALENINDGFGIADADFKLRGPGNYFGEEQSGFIALEYADFETDYKIWEYAKSDALAYLDDYLKGKEKSFRFDKILLDNEKVGFKSN